MPIRSGLLLALLLAGVYNLTADILYSITDLGALPGYPFSSASAINNTGQVTGASSAFIGAGGANSHAFLYSNGQMTDLGTLPGYPGSIGIAINNVGQAVCDAVVPGAYDGSTAFLYSNGQVTALGAPSGFTSDASGINDAGQVVGSFRVFGFRGPGNAFLYSNGQFRNLNDLIDPSLHITLWSASGINSAGQVTGAAATSTGVVDAFLYSNGQVKDLGNLGGQFNQFSSGQAINNAGQVTGATSTPAGGPEHAFLYSNGRMMDLGEGSGNAINNAGQVVGYFYTSIPSVAPYHASLYSNGQAFDLNDLIDPTLGITLNTATGINDKGQIVANDSITEHAYLLTPIAAPVPEPSTLALFGVALLGLGVWTRARQL